MRVRTMQAVQVFRGVRDHLTGKDIPVRTGTLAKHLENLEGIIGRLTSFAVEQDSTNRAALAGTIRRRRLLEELRQEFMRPVSQLATQLFPDDEEMQRALSMPPFRDHERILAAANAMIDRATPHKDRFATGGFAADFLDRFKKAVADLQATIDEQTSLIARRSAATVGQLDELQRGRDLVRLLDTMIAPRLKATPAQAKEWRKLTRFRPFPVSEPETEGAPAPEVKAA